jgi:glycosyltransferase involved in cell wall biosynthesis
VGTDLNDRYATELKEFIQKEALKAFVFIYGNCADTFEILKQATIGVLASKSEGLTVSLLEYGLVSLTVVATDVGAIRNVIIQNKTGVLVPAANHLKLSEALLNLINNKDTSIQLGAALHIFVSKYFSNKKYINQLISIYQFV